MSTQPSAAEVVPILTPGLGNHAYLVASEGEAAVIDPPRDAWRIAEIVEERGWRISHALETHVHNDYLSGARELRRSHRATIVAPAEGRYLFPHQPAQEDTRVELGAIALVARATPGHTPEHLSWELEDGETPVGLFSGGSLLIGGVGRTDLLGPRRTDELTRAQFRSMRRLAELPDGVRVYPTHGAGSFCVAGDSDGPSSATIGALRQWNPAFRASDLAAFEAELDAARTRYPIYYRRMAPLNRRGPRMLGEAPAAQPLTAREVAAARDTGVWLIDVRDRWAFAERHVRGSWNIELGDSLASYVGWLLPFDAPMVLVVDDAWQEVEVATELLRIGYDHVLGHLHGGLDAWVAAGGATSSYETAGWQELRAFAAGHDGQPGRILDVRQPYEWRQGAIPGSRRVFVADLPESVDGLRREAAWLVACRTGTRSTIAASILDAAGVPARPVVDGGVPALPPDELQPAA